MTYFVLCRYSGNSTTSSIRFADGSHPRRAAARRMGRVRDLVRDAHHRKGSVQEIQLALPGHR